MEAPNGQGWAHWLMMVVGGLIVTMAHWLARQFVRSRQDASDELQKERAENNEQILADMQRATERLANALEKMNVTLTNHGERLAAIDGGPRGIRRVE